MRMHRLADFDSVRHGGIDESGQIVIETIRLFHKRCMTRIRVQLDLNVRIKFFRPSDRAARIHQRVVFAIEQQDRHSDLA